MSKKREGGEEGEEEGNVTMTGQPSEQRTRKERESGTLRLAISKVVIMMTVKTVIACNVVPC